MTQLFSSYVVSSLQQYAQAPARNWRAKDTAVYLVVALTVQGRTRAQETTATNQLVNVLDFFGSCGLPAAGWRLRSGVLQRGSEHQHWTAGSLVAFVGCSSPMQAGCADGVCDDSVEQGSRCI